MISAIIVLVLILIFVKPGERMQPGVVPKIDNRDVALPEKRTQETPVQVQKENKVKVAIVIDDMGFDGKIFRKFVDLGIPITFSILPGERFSGYIAKKAKLLNYEVMLHLPMEPRNPLKNPGKGEISIRMSKEEMLRQLSKDIKAVPYIVGINNHMGSLLTENRIAMNALLEEIHKKGLFFLDSKTSPNSVAYKAAKSIGVPSGRRDVFLDNNPDIRYIKGQLDKVIKIAKQNGSATAIGHPKPETVAALREKIEDFKKEGIEFVPVSAVLE